jgi:hypothetical protein
VASASLYSSWYNVRWLSTSSKWILSSLSMLGD